MAKDANTSDDAAAAGKPSGSNIKKIVLIAIAAIALVGVSVGATVFLTGGSAKQEVTKGKNAKAKSKKPADEEAEADAAEGDKGLGEGEQQAEGEDDTNPDETPAVVTYLDFDQPFVVNFQDEGQLRYVQISVSVMVKDPKVVEHVRRHMPLIRNNLVMLFSGQTRETVLTREGKERIRKDAEAEVQKILKEQTGKPGVKSLYFTSFVMQ